MLEFPSMTSLMVASVTAASLLSACATPSTTQDDPAATTPPEPPAQDAPLIGGLAREVATSKRQWTGIAASDDGRIFVNYPLWSDAQPFAVGELQSDGTVAPYPNEALNSWAPGEDASASFVCVQAMLVVGSTLWVLDPASPRFEGVVEGGAKLVSIDLSTNTVTRTYPFDPTVATPKSYLNDVRISPDGAVAYITDSGDGAIIVLDLNTGAARRVLDDHVATEAENISLTIEGKPFDNEVHADGIALSDDGSTLYFQALRGRTLYAAPTALLRDPDVNPLKLAAKLRVIEGVGASDGILYLDGYVYLTSLEHDAIRRLTPDDEVEVVVSDPLIAWPDSFALTKDTLFFTTAQIHRGATPGEPYRIFAIERAALTPR